MVSWTNDSRRNVEFNQKKWIRSWSRSVLLISSMQHATTRSDASPRHDSSFFTEIFTVWILLQHSATTCSIDKCYCKLIWFMQIKKTSTQEKLDLRINSTKLAHKKVSFTNVNRIRIHTSSARLIPLNLHTVECRVARGEQEKTLESSSVEIVSRLKQDDITRDRTKIKEEKKRLKKIWKNNFGVVYFVNVTWWIISDVGNWMRKFQV